jgi:hypothetical protein
MSALRHQLREHSAELQRARQDISAMLRMAPPTLLNSAKARSSKQERGGGGDEGGKEGAAALRVLQTGLARTRGVLEQILVEVCM